MRQQDVFLLPDGRHGCGRGLQLVVKNNGKSRSWILRLCHGGRRYEFGLGAAKTLSLKAAQVKADQYRGLVASGYDPRPAASPAPAPADLPAEAPLPAEEPVRRSESTAAEKEKAPEQLVHRFEDVADEAIRVCAEVRQWRNAKHEMQWTSTLKTYVFPKLGKKDVAEITRDDVLSVLKPIWKEKTETAKRVRGRMEIVFDYAARRGWRKTENPAKWSGYLEFDLPNPEKITVKSHHEAPTIPELQAAAIELYRTGSRSTLCTLFGILTATRCQEFCGARWEEINFENRIWSIPPERRKDGKPYPHRVPLSPWAVKVLRKVPRSTNGWIFEGTRQPHIHYGTPRVIIRHYIKRNVTMHGCRSSFSDWCAETGKDVTLTEKSLMHSTGNAVREAYQRSDLLEQRRPLMDEYANVIMAKACEVLVRLSARSVSATRTSEIR